MAFKQKKAVQTPADKFNSARGNLMIVVVFTVINLVLLMLDTDTQFLFSASFPSLAFALGDVLADELGMSILRTGALLLAIGNIGLYFICWLFSKKRRGFMIFALILFILDCLILGVMCLALYTDFDYSVLIDVVFHGWVLISLISGVAASAKLSQMERQPAPQPMAQGAVAAAATSIENAQAQGFVQVPDAMATEGEYIDPYHAKEETSPYHTNNDQTPPSL